MYIAKAILVKEKYGIDMEAVRQEILAGRFDIENVLGFDRWLCSLRALRC